MLRGENIGDATASPIAVFADQQRGVGKPFGKVRIMQSDDDGGARIGALAQQLQRFELVVRIKLVGRLVQ